MEVKTNNKKPANKKTAKKKSSNLVGKNSKSTKAKPTTKSVRKISAIKPIPADIFSDKKRVIVKEVDTGGETIIAAEQATAKFTPVKTKKNSKISQALERARVRAEKNYAIAAAKAKLAEERANARDEQALAIEIDNAETLVTDENSVIDPLTANENAQLNCVNEIKIAPVSSIEINGVNVDVSSKHAKKKIAKIRRKTNWHKKLYFIAPAISVAAIACALTPIAIVKPIQALQPVITMDDDSSEGVVVKSQNVHINKDSTITLSTRDEERITNVDIKMHDQSLNSDQYSFDQMSNVVTIKASAMTTVDDIKLKVVTDLPRFEPKFEPTTKGISNVTFSSKYASFRKAFVITCDIKDGYVLDQDALTSGLVLTVGDRQLTDPNEVEIKPVNDSNTKYTITIKPGIVNDAVKLSGEITKYNVKIQKDATVANNYVASCHNGFETTVGKIADIQDVVTLENSETRKGYKPEATITVDNNGAKIPLEVDSDYVIKSVWRNDAYHYDLIWTDNGKQKILGPVTIDLKASTDEIKWELEEQFKDPKWADIAVGMNSRKQLNFKATVENGAVDVKDVKIIKGANLGYALNDELQLVPLPGIIQSTGTITVQARIDELVKTVDVNVIEPYITINSTAGHRVRVNHEAEGFTPTIYPKYLQEDTQQVNELKYKWTSDDDNIMKVIDGDKVKVMGVTKGVTSLTATTTLATKTGITYNCIGKYKINSVMPTWDESSWLDIVTAVNTFYLEYYKEGASKSDKIQAMKNLCNSFDDIEYIETINQDITDPNKQVEAHLANFIGKTKTIQLNGLDHGIQIVGINHDTIAESKIIGEKGEVDLKGKKALFTFDSTNVLLGKDNSGNKISLRTWWDNFDGGNISGRLEGNVRGEDYGPCSKNWYFCKDQYKSVRHLSLLYKALNYNTNKTEGYVKFDVSDSYNIFKTSETEAWYNAPSAKYRTSVYQELTKSFEQELPEGTDCPVKYVTKQVAMLQGMPADYDHTSAKAFDGWFTWTGTTETIGKKTYRCNSGHRHSEYAVENYDAYCFPLTTIEANIDGSKIVSGGVPHAAKNEGETYCLYEKDPTKLIKMCWHNSQWVKASFLSSSPAFWSSSGSPDSESHSFWWHEREKFPNAFYFNNGAQKMAIDVGWTSAGHASSYISFAFCI